MPEFYEVQVVSRECRAAGPRQDYVSRKNRTLLQLHACSMTDFGMREDGKTQAGVVDQEMKSKKARFPQKLLWYTVDRSRNPNPEMK
jgi:uncharacterized membrane-anchored protein